RLALARSARALWPLHDGLQPLQSLGEGGGVAARLRGAGGEIATIAAPDRQLDHPGPPARRRRKKDGPDNAIGRSRGGLSTKINALVDERGLPVRIVLPAGQTSAKAAVPALIEGLPPARALIADRGYGAGHHQSDPGQGR